MNATTENAFCSNASCDAATNNLWNAMQHESGIRQIDTSPINAEAEKQQQPFHQSSKFQSADSVIWCDAVVHMSTFVCTRNRSARLLTLCCLRPRSRPTKTHATTSKNAFFLLGRTPRSPVPQCNSWLANSGLWVRWSKPCCFPWCSYVLYSWYVLCLGWLLALVFYVLTFLSCWLDLPLMLPHAQGWHCTIKRV